MNNPPLARLELDPITKTRASVVPLKGTGRGVLSVENTDPDAGTTKRTESEIVVQPGEIDVCRLKKTDVENGVIVRCWYLCESGRFRPREPEGGRCEEQYIE